MLKHYLYVKHSAWLTTYILVKMKKDTSNVSFISLCICIHDIYVLLEMFIHHYVPEYTNVYDSIPLSTLVPLSMIKEQKNMKGIPYPMVGAIITLYSIYHLASWTYNFQWFIKPVIPSNSTTMSTMMTQNDTYLCEICSRHFCSKTCCLQLYVYVILE